jgi:8-amino-7-oxononanoate synthase
MSTSDWIEERMRESLRQRRAKGTLRRLPAATEASRRDSNDKRSEPVDFSSNDYLGLARNAAQKRRVEALWQEASKGQHTATLGATGSRLLSGDAAIFHELETYLATVHQRPAALLCNSGYDANLALVSSLPCDVIFYDEFAHNSLHMAMRLWQESNQKGRRQWRPFRHNSVAALGKLLESSEKDASVVVVVESVYSMDGDCAPLADVLNLADRYGARVVVDEAHGLGVSGATGLLSTLGLHQHPALLSAVYTFGKAAGCHGAVITGSQTLKSYLVNYGYPLIYSTAMPLHSLCTIQAAYESMIHPRGDALRSHLTHLIRVFHRLMQSEVLENRQADLGLISSSTPIQALLVPGNQRCSALCQAIWKESRQRIRLFPIKSPTVPAGKERVRIVLHAHNTEDQVRELVSLIAQCVDKETRNRQAIHSRL